MTIAFNQIPANLRVPLFWAELQAGQSPYQSISRVLLIGQKTAAGTATADEPVIVTGGEDALFGVGSMLAAMYKTARMNGPFQEIWALPLADAAGATAAAGSILVAGAPLAAASSVVIYAGDIRVAVPVTTTMTNADIAAAIAAAINVCEGMQVTATVNAGVPEQVDLVANNAGTLGNTIRIETRLYRDDSPMADSILTIAQPSGGAGDPLITTALANLGDEEFDWIAMPYFSAAYISEMTAFLDTRWGPLAQQYGHAFTTVPDTHGNILAAAAAHNTAHVTMLGVYNAPAPAYLWTAAMATIAAVHLSDAPELSRPLHTLTLRGLRAPKLVSDRWSVVQRQSLYYGGVSGYTVARDGSVTLDRVITLYTQNAWGSPDATWLDINTIAQAVYGIRFLRQKVTSTYPRVALVDSNPGNLQGVVTADDIRSVIVHGYRELTLLGVFENPELFEELLVVERNASDPNRVDAYLPVDHTNQLRIIAVNVTSYLSYPAA